MGKGLGYFTGYPFHVFLILANEFCERFSYYGMKAVLVFFLWKALNYSESTATALYHAFVVFCYAAPILGAMIADGWLGKYKTILYVSMIYACGNILMTVSAIKINGSYTDWVAFVALFVIAFGTGGIKPCVSSFGGDQFKEDQVRQKDSFFSLFYLTINIGSMISTILIPFLRGNVHCFEDNCYSLCFGIPAILMIISIVLFSLGSKWYTRNPPGDSILTKFFGCIGKALSRKCCCGSSDDGEKKEHWLDYAGPEYEQSFIEDVKDVLRVAWLFIPLPVFWALFDQQGSKWAFQAQQMNGDLPGITVYPDMISFLNPLMVVVIVPFLEYLVYPCLDKMHIPNRPLQRMTLGMLLAAVAFLVTGFLQIAINANQPATIQPSQTKYHVINASPNDVNVSIKCLGGADVETIGYTIPSLKSSGAYHYTPSGKYAFGILWLNDNVPKDFIFEFEELKAYQIFVTVDKVAVSIEQNRTSLTSKGESSARVFNGLKYKSRVQLMTTEGEETGPRDFGDIDSFSVSASQNLIFADFSATYTDASNNKIGLKETIKSRNGPVYSLVLAQDNANEVHLTQIEEVPPWSINIFMQTPQYLIMTFAECLFSVTGLSFAYTQAPPAMKSILTAIWLLTVCFGNIIIIIVQGASGAISQVFEFFLFSGLMFVTTIIFAIMCVFYTYVTPRTQTTIDTLDTTKYPDNTLDTKNTQDYSDATKGQDTKESKNGMSNHSFNNDGGKGHSTAF